MPSTSRRRLVPVAILAAVVLLAFASPAFASPPLDAPTSPIAWVLDWWAQFVEPPGSEHTNVRSKGTSVPNLDPNGIETLPPILFPGSTGEGATTQNDGESVPNLDPDG